MSLLDHLKRKEEVRDEAAAEIELGKQAETVMNTKAFKLTQEALREHYLTKWQDSPPGDTEGREEAYRALKNLEMVMHILTATMQSGRLTAGEIERQEKAAQKLADKKKAHEARWKG